MKEKNQLKNAKAVYGQIKHYCKTHLKLKTGKTLCGQTLKNDHTYVFPLHWGDQYEISLEEEIKMVNCKNCMKTLKKYEENF